jgi:hypothetical protein
MDRIIKEELNRVKSLMFLQESIINENLSAEAGGLAKIIKQGGAEAKVLEKELEAILPTIKGGLGAKGAQLKTIEDLLFAIKSDSLSVADMGALNFSILKRGKLKPNLLDEIAKDVVNQKTFIGKYSKGTPASRLAELKLANPKLAKENPAVINRIHQANELRLKNLGKDVKGGEDVLQQTKNFDDVGQGAKNFDDASRGSQNVSQNVTVNIGGSGIRDEKQFLKQYGPEIDDFYRTYGKEADDLARKNGHTSFAEWMAKDADGAMNRVREESKSGKGLWGRFIDWGKRRIKWKALWGLAKIAGVAYGVWWLFFKKDGFKVECPTGQHFEEGKGCVSDGGGGGGGGGGNNTVTPEKITDNEGKTYTECSSPYYKGCVGKKGDDNIKKAQDCLGVTPNGFFNQETEDALVKKINKKSFSPADLPTICARSLGTQRYEY